MHVRITLALIVSSIFFSSSAEEIAISGQISGNSTAIAGARISLKNNSALVTFSDNTGKFTLSSSSPVIKQVQNKLSGTTLCVKNNTLTVVTTQQQSLLNINLYTLNGKVLFSRKMSSVIPGKHTFQIPENCNTGIVLMEIKNESKLYTAKFNSVSTITIPDAKYATAGKMQASAGTYKDTLIVTVQGWKNSLIGISDYKSDNINITLSKTNSWVPTGSITKEKGMVKIMASGYDFEMGQPDSSVGVEDRLIEEQPVHTVSFTHDFWMDTAEVTQGQYDSVMKKAYSDYITPAWDSKFGKGDNFPAYLVSWDEGALYCNARSKAEGLDTVYSYSDKSAAPGEMCELIDVKSDLFKNGYRLPTEAEWEYACKAGKATDFFWSKNYDATQLSTASYTQEISNYAVWRVNAWDLGEGKSGFGVHTAGRKLPNSYGLYDMIGNLSEYCHDYESESYEYGSATDPTGPATGDGYHIIRGGNWGNDAVSLRSANRYFSTANYPFFFAGFRTVRPVKAN